MGRLAAELRSLRDDAAMTQEELAEAAGLSVRTISDIERGARTRLYRDTAVRLGVALGLADAVLADFVENARGRAAGLRRDLDAQFRRRFVAWHVDRVTELSQHVGSEGAWFAILDADAANLTVALRWAAEAGDAESLLLLGSGLFRYWQARGELVSGRRWIERGLEVVPAALPATRMSALWALAWLAHQQGDDTCTAECARELRELAAAISDPVGRRNAATIEGLVALAGDEIGDALRHFAAALEYARTAGDPWLAASSLLNLAMAEIAAGRTPEARVLLGEALRAYEDLGDERFHARSLGYLGLAALAERDIGRAEALYAQSLTVFAALGEDKGIAEALTGLASAAAISGGRIRAARLGGAAERLRETFAGRALPVERRQAAVEFARARAEGPDGWDEEWTRGRALRIDEAIEEALGQIDG